MGFFATYGNQAILLVLFLTFGWFGHIFFEWLKETNRWKRFRFRLSTSEQYWRISAFFVLMTVASSVVILWLSPSYETKSSNFGLLVQVATLVFGLYTGYFAFRQVNLGRFNEIATTANKLFLEGKYKKAIKEYEAATEIKFDFINACEQAECYVCMEDWEGYERIIELLPNAQVDDRDTLLFFYVQSLGYFIDEDLKEVKGIIKKAIEAKKSMKQGVRMSWSTVDIEKSDCYKATEESIKKLFKDFSSYLNNEGEIASKEAFENAYGGKTKKKKDEQ